MTRYNFIIQFVLFLILFGCSQNRQEKSELDHNIIIVNYKYANRADFSLAINKLNKCKPEIIGLNALFVERKDSSDILLAHEIASAENIVLATNINSDSLIRSNDYFTSKCMAEGVVNFAFDGDVVTKYKPYTEFDWSFPVTLVTYYNPERGKEIIKNTLPNEFYKITHFKKQFVTIDIDRIGECDCTLIQNKIVIMGFLGPGSEDYLITPEDKDKGTFTYKTIILANIVFDLLSNNP